jgi:G3E family GTPase
VDAKHVLRHLDEQKPEGVENEAVEQVAFADRILLNKVDLVSLAEKAEVVRRLRGINAFAEVLEATHSRFDLDKVLGVGAFDLGRVLEVRTDYYSPREDSWAWRARALCNAI